MKRNGSLHKGHRKRFLRNFLSGSKLTTVQTVEALLFYCFRQGDTNETAHRLLDRFGSFEKLLYASESEIMSVKGMGPVSTQKLRLLPDAVLEHRRIVRDRSNATEWSYYSIVAFLSEKISPRLMREDVGCVAVILKDGMTAESVNVSSPDPHLINVINKHKSNKDISLVCFSELRNDCTPLSAQDKALFASLGVDAITTISTHGKIHIELI